MRYAIFPCPCLQKQKKTFRQMMKTMNPIMIVGWASIFGMGGEETDALV